MQRLLSIIGMLCTTSAFSEIDLVSLYPKAQLFKQYKKVHQKYHLIEGDIRYITDMSDDAEEGYLPHKMSSREGMLKRTVYDHTETDSAVEIAKNMRKELQRKDFEIVYECAREECGDVAGWRLYMSRHIEGYADRQYYLLARHPHKRDGEWILAFYVNEFSNIPRSVIHVLDTSEIAFDQYVIDRRQLGVWLARGDSVELKGLFFAFDSAQISGDSHKILEQLSDVLKNAPDMNISIEGHTDDVGSETYNLDLSIRRAAAVKEYLVLRGIEAARLSVQGFGERKPKMPSQDLRSRAQNRRVEVVKINANG